MAGVAAAIGLPDDVGEAGGTVGEIPPQDGCLEGEGKHGSG